MTGSRPYHHGDLRRAILSAAAGAIEEHGPAGLSMRDLARRAGVSHTAPVHHFGDKAGLLTAVAAEGYTLLADALHTVENDGGGLIDLGVAYVGFAVSHRAHFEVMFRPDLYHQDDPAVLVARERAWASLARGVGSGKHAADLDPALGAVAAWSIVHGFATLCITGALPLEHRKEPERTAEAVARLLFPDS